MIPSKSCIDTIKRFEGCELHAYPDPLSGGDPWTVGYGATGPGIKRGTVWTQQQAEDRLRVDVAHFGQSIMTALQNALTTQGQFDALVSFAFNVGLRKATGSTLWFKHVSHDYTGAAAEFGRWINKGTPVEKGLTIRRTAEAKLYRGEL